MEFSKFRQEVWQANLSLPKAGLVTMHSGNVSGFHRESGVVLIKPSGIDYELLRPEDLVAVAISGETLSAKLIPDGLRSPLKPSVDTIHHLGLYQADEAICGVVHTHSNYATAWATHERPIPCALTAIADEFGGEIPCTPYVDNLGENIVRAILAHRTQAPAVLLGRHGVFAFAQSAKAALKAAVMVEDVARTLLLAKSLGDLSPLPAAEIKKWWNRYHTTYGQTV